MPRSVTGRGGAAFDGTGHSARMIRFDCSHCGHQFNLEDHFAGRHGWCTHCKYPIIVPATDGSQTFESFSDAEKIRRLQEVLHHAAERIDKMQRRAKRLEARLEAAERKAAEADQLRSELDDVHSRLAGAGAELERQRELANKHAAVYSEEANELAELEAQNRRLSTALEAANRHAETLEQALEDTEARLRQSEEDTGGRLQALEEALASEESQHAAARRAAEEAQERAAQTDEALQQARGAQERLEQELEGVCAERDALSANLNKSEAEANEARTALDAAHRQLERAGDERDRLRADVDGERAAREQAETSLAEALEAHSSAVAERDALKARLAEAPSPQALEDAERRCAEAEEELTRLRALVDEAAETVFQRYAMEHGRAGSGESSGRTRDETGGRADERRILPEVVREAADQDNDALLESLLRFIQSK